MTPELRRHFGVETDRGVLISEVEPRSAAAAAGLRVGDILTEVQNQPINAATDVQSALSSIRKGQQFQLTVIRDREDLTLNARLPGAGSQQQPQVSPQSIPPSPQMGGGEIDQQRCRQLMQEHNEELQQQQNQSYPGGT
ncbi:MAG: PDZ domain-containing protein [Deltaproteobacteria bacterium]|nr:PDZ domain-containing protein [Deltaproteobacteria bacterium]